MLLRENESFKNVFIILVGQLLRKTFIHKGVILANRNLPEKTHWICREEKDISEFPENSRGIYKRNMIDRYIDQPNLVFSSSKYAILNGFCLAEFVRYYY